MSKIKCISCDAKAVWCYMPGTDNNYYCDEHVPRGCSCNYKDEESDNQFTDEQGRLVPCCEYGFDEEGYFFIDSEEDLKEVNDEIHFLWNNAEDEFDGWRFEYLTYLVKEYKEKN
jgi:hypothetical protein